VQMSVNSVTLGLKFKSFSPVCSAPLLSPFAPSFQLCIAIHTHLLHSLLFRRFESSLNAALVFCGGFFPPGLPPPSAPGSRHSFSLLVKTFSSSARRLQTVPFVPCTYLKCLNGKRSDGIGGEGKKASIPSQVKAL